MAGDLREIVARARRIVVKVGTSSITYPNGKVDLLKLDRLTRQLADVQNGGREVLLVSSGAVGAGMGRLGFSEKPKTVPEKQALAAVGQGILIHMYQKLFGEYGHTVAQVLLTRGDLADRKRYLNARNTLTTLLRLGIIPIINENDTVATDEIRLSFGDNDTLSALVAVLVDADLLIVLTDIDGLYTDHPAKNPDAKRISLVDEITPEIEALAGDSISGLGTGGMCTKISAARMAVNSGIAMVIAAAKEPDVLRRTLHGEELGTLFLPCKVPLETRKRWIAFGSSVHGSLTVDQGAVQALCAGKSLLPSGIQAVDGHFDVGNVVAVLDPKGREVARGLVNYTFSQVNRIKGRKSGDIAAILGDKPYDEVIHRDHLTLLVHA